MRKIIAAAVLLGLAACVNSVVSTQIVHLTPAQVTEMTDIVRHSMKDPAAAQFRNIRAARSTLEDGSTNFQVCGEVNGKNSFGAYVGYRTFVVKQTQQRSEPFLYGIADANTEWIYAGDCSLFGL